jgi:ADP-heptose:LPS heptosyltransferase
MGNRLATRTLAVTRAIGARLAAPADKSAAINPARILVAHNLLLGDTIMLTPLLAKLRAQHPQANITLLAHPAFAPLYSARPYGVRVLPFTPHQSATTETLLEELPFDFAVVPGDNRYSWLAAAAGARHVVAHAGDTPWSKSWFVDEERPYSAQPAAWGDMVAQLVDGPEPEPYRAADWPEPAAAAFDKPPGTYAVLHVGASTPLKQWPAQRWAELANHLHSRGITPVWSAGRSEQELVSAADPQGQFPSYAGKLDLAQLWHLLKGASLLVAPDTGVAHLGRVTFTPTVTLFGPGSTVICGSGQFWRNTPYAAVTVDPFPCRDQRILFRREIDWVRRCGRSTAECPAPRCMHAIEVAAVTAAVDRMLAP